MKPILIAPILILLLIGMSCSAIRHGNRRNSPESNSRGFNYKLAALPNRSITAIVKDSAENQPLPFAIVELYTNNDRVTALMTAVTTLRGKFNFPGLPTGDYVIIISHSRFKEREVIVTVKGSDINLNEVRLCPVFD